MKLKNLCLDCPEDIRGKCCHVSAYIGKYNIILNNVACPYLNPFTGECAVYDHRDKKPKWCVRDKKMFNRGCLPEGCLYLLEDPTREKNPRQQYKDLIHVLTDNEKFTYHGMNDKPFEFYLKELKKKKKR